MQVCLFDIDGTLLRSGGAGKAAMEAALASAFGVPPSAQDVPFSGRTDRAIARDLFAIHGVEHNDDNWQSFVANYLSHLPDCLTRLHGSVLPGIADLLTMLCRRPDVAVGLLTGNIRAGARAKLSHYGLFEHFAFGGFGDHHWERDEVAREALAQVQEHVHPAFDPAQIWVIGDTPLDVRCARAIGARAVAVATGWHSLEELALTQPDLVIADFADAGPLLNQLGAL